VGITKFVQKAAAGLLMEKELRYLGKALQHPEKQFIAILGGAKVSDKIGVIQNLMSKVDSLLIGGGMAYTFLKAQGFEVGKSLVEAEQACAGANPAGEAKKRKLTFLLPVDHLAAAKIEPTAVVQQIDEGQPIPANLMALDIGPKTIELFSEEISRLAPSYGTAPWAFSRCRHFRRERTKSPKPWRTMWEQLRLWVAGIRFPPCAPPGWRTRSRISPRGAEPR